MRPFKTINWNYLSLIFRGAMAARLWLVAYAVLIIIPASIFLYLYSQRYSHILEEEVTRTMLQTLKQAEINLDHQFNSIRDTSNSLFTNPNLLKYLKVAATPADQLEALKELRYIIDNAKTNLNVFRVRIYVDEDKLFSHEKFNFFPLDSIQSRPWYGEIAEAGGMMTWTGAYLENYIDVGETYIFSNLRMLRDPDHYDILPGVLSVDMDVRQVDSILSTIQLNKDQTVYMLAPDGKIVLHSDKKLLGTKLSSTAVLNAVQTNAEGVSPIAEGNRDLYVVYTTINATGWKLVAEVPKKGINSRAVSLNQFSSVATLTGVTVMFLILVFILMAFIVQGMNRRVQTVIRAIKREGLEGLEDRSGTMAIGDFKVLENSVDHLIHRVRDLMEETYTTKVQEREAQLRALQAQINPHFLYNTLDTINWIAIGRGAQDISQMIDSLAKYFRLSLNKGKDVVTVTDELELAKVYLEIQQTRFPKSFEFAIVIQSTGSSEDGTDAAAELSAFFIPKLTLQPIVENALLHGIRKSKGKTGTITLTAAIDGDELTLTVRDDGIGMEPAFAQSLLTEPRPTMRSDGSGSSYGLYNVNERIKLFTGEAQGLFIESQLGEGTTITARFPRRPISQKEHLS
ncbi:cache domain-containing sensor histidine kinase [Paenibacillus whitsoniae]|uniref:histidine kinase n=1 Tax=Paenibacillus whitsoniae TaxID=2496558 RepID=A0A3S0ADU5_9BACL|nr:sensor histidine kinase [Paenibacillus whitsoniae]RTE10622.1 sensor histidine kinase [Paenibacillus whitsoniae]